jgi:Mrp family chromosome partitioning ATPase
MIRSNIKFMSVDHNLKTLMVTSSGKGEGKSTTAANLAVAMAQDGRKVTLVDADLRRPTVHKQFNVSNSVGLTNAIVSGARRGGLPHNGADPGADPDDKRAADDEPRNMRRT